MKNLKEYNTAVSKLNCYDLVELLKMVESQELSLRSKLNLRDILTFGLEIEYQELAMLEIKDFIKKINKQYDKNNKWIIKWDDSVCYVKDIDGARHVFGGELTSRILNDNSNVWSELKKICDTLKDKGAVVGNSSGGHIHFGKNIFEENVNYLLNFIKFWMIYEKLIYRFSYGDNIGPRKNILFMAHPLSLRLYKELKNYSKINNYFELLGDLPMEKKIAVNFHVRDEINPKETVEFRCPNGTINPVIWQNNVNFFGKMLMYCSSDKFDEEFINYKLKHYCAADYDWSLYNEIYLGEALQLCDLVFDNDLDKLYFLKQYLKSFQLSYNEDENMKRIKLCA